MDDLDKISGKYSIIYTDPPWKQTKGGLRKSRPNQQRNLDYDTISLDQIKQHHEFVKENLCEENHIVFMWTIDKFLHESENFMRDLGYKLHARFIWDKQNGVAPAFTVRYSHEYLLWFYQDKLKTIDKEQRGKFRTVISEKSTKHSKKPVSVYEMIEALYPDSKRLEMYARNTRDGWVSWGNEIEEQKEV